MHERLKYLRKTLHLKQREIAEQLDIQTSNVGDWEANRKQIPRARIYQICKEFHVRREWLEHGIGEMFEPDPAAVVAEEEREKYILEVFLSLTKAQQNEIIKVLRQYIFSGDNNLNITNSIVGKVINGNNNSDNQ